MAKPNYQFEKRQRDLAKKQKQEEKRRQKLAAKAAGGTPAVSENFPAEASNAPTPPVPDGAAPKPETP